LIREQVLRLTEQEVPPRVAIEIEEWLERERGWYIRATIYVEKDSQRGIMIGSAGNMLRRIGSAARVSIERHLACATYLDLWVKVRTGWRDDPTALHWLGYRRSAGESS
jgi:GTP-binding protein Era